MSVRCRGTGNARANLEWIAPSIEDFCEDEHRDRRPAAIRCDAATVQWIDWLQRLPKSWRATAMEGMASPALLRGLRFFDGMPAESIVHVARIARMVEFPAQTMIFREGGENETFFVIVEGHVLLQMNVPARGGVPILTLGPGDVLAWSVALGNAKSMTATATTLEPTRALAIPDDALRSLCESDGKVGYHLFRQLAAALSKRLLATRLQLLDLFAETSTP